MPAENVLRRGAALLRRHPGPLSAFVLAVALAPIPLVGVWGYESSLLFAPFLALLGIGRGVADVAALRDAPDAGPDALVVRSLVGPLRSWGAAVAGLATAWLWQRVCDPWGGLALFAAGAGASAIVGWWTGALAAMTTPYPKRARWIGFALFALSTLVALVRLYRDPAVFAFDPYWGYFAGAIYDEDVAVGPVYLAYRRYNALALAGAVLFALAVMDRRRLLLHRPRLGRDTVLWAFAATVCTARAVYVGVTADERGFHATTWTLERALPRTFRTEHFVLHFAPATATHREIEALAAEHEFAYATLAARLGVEPDTPIHSYVFPDRGTKRAVMGAGRVEVAPPWRRSLYLHHRPFPPASLFHELAHAFESALGDPIFGLSLRAGLPNMGLVEGLATAMADPVVDDLSIHEQAAVLRRLGRLPPLDRVFGPGFWTLAGRHAYTAAGSFVAFLAETYGDEVLAPLYAAGGDTDTVLDEPMDALEARWHAHLDALPLSGEVLRAQQERFRVRSIFARPCAHRMARLAAEVARARARGAYDETTALLERACELEPFEPRRKLQLAAEHAAWGAYDDARAIYRAVADDEAVSPSLRADAANALALLDLLDGNLARAAAAIEAALALDVPPALRRRLELTARAVTSSALRSHILAYLRPFENRDDAVSLIAGRVAAAGDLGRAPEGRALGPYLAGRQLANAADDAPAASALGRAAAALADDPSLLSAAFARALDELHAATALAAGDLDAARRALDRLEGRLPATDGAARLLQRWRRRLAFHDDARPRPDARPQVRSRG